MELAENKIKIALTMLIDEITKINLLFEQDSIFFSKNDTTHLSESNHKKQEILKKMHNSLENILSYNNGKKYQSLYDVVKSQPEHITAEVNNLIKKLGKTVQAASESLEKQEIIVQENLEYTKKIWNSLSDFCNNNDSYEKPKNIK